MAWWDHEELKSPEDRSDKYVRAFPEGYSQKRVQEAYDAKREVTIPYKIAGTPRTTEPEGKIVFHETPMITKEGLEAVRTFNTGATRSKNDDKLDFRGFLSPIALRAFAEYMHKNRVQPDGTIRPSDNWQKGIPLQSYMESMWRHFFAVWEAHEQGGVANDDDLAGLFFNVQGYMHEIGLKRKA